MNDFLEKKINDLNDVIAYYTDVIKEAKIKKFTHINPSVASDNYYDREIYYAEIHLFKAKAELNRLESKVNSRLVLR